MGEIRVVLIGAGYVGLTSAVTFAYLGCQVTCVDVDTAKIGLLKSGKIPLFEPHLEELLALSRDHISFETSCESSVPLADVVIIAVGTPPGPDGAPDLSYLESAARAVGSNLSSRFCVVVNKSTVPIGSANWIEAIIRDAHRARHGELAKPSFAVASNPEFLREGSAVADTLYPDRTVIGADDPGARAMLVELYQPVTEQTFVPPAFSPRPEGLTRVPLFSTDLASAELVKYAANAFLSMKISFANEIAELAEKVGADALQVARGIGADARIGSRFLAPGVGWGGSCFGKDTAALVAIGREYGLEMPLVRAARAVNDRQRDRVVEKLLQELKILKGRTIGLLGAAFKPFTDDLRDAPSLDIAARLVSRGAKVRVHDPVALDRVRRSGVANLETCDTVEQLATEADALVLVTEWPEYVTLPWPELARRMRNPLVVDGRNVLSREVLLQAGFRYIPMGR